ncbi:peptidoglycan-binding protein [Kitasatospora indigofera]|uniref:peptidoglycan-binding domain-containing protein n=1 Tax=Kitasatospora indigofera TaxID=67307 RepID=UPI003646969B
MRPPRQGRHRRPEDLGRAGPLEQLRRLHPLLTGRRPARTGRRHGHGHAPGGTASSPKSSDRPHYAFGQYPAIAEDGVWGPRTKAAVQEFQYLFSANTTGVMVQDGIVGRMTGEHLLQYGDPYYTGGPVQPSDAYRTRYLPNGF